MIGKQSMQKYTIGIDSVLQKQKARRADSHT